MPIGFTSGGGGTSGSTKGTSFEEEWRRRRQLLAQQATMAKPDYSSRPVSSVIGSVGGDIRAQEPVALTATQAMMNKMNTAEANRTSEAAIRAAAASGASGAGSGAGAAANAIGAGISSAPNTATGGHQANTALGKDYANYWFYDFPQSSLAELKDDPEKTALLYAQHRTPGSADALAASLGGLPDPESMMLAMGYNQPFGNNPDFLKTQSQLYDMSLGRGSGAPRYTDPLALIQNVLADAATLGTGGDFGGARTELQRRFQAAGANPRAVATMVNQTIASALFGLMPENSYNALMGQLARAQQEYDTMYLKEPTGTMPNYAQWVQSKLGLNLGM